MGTFLKKNFSMLGMKCFWAELFLKTRAFDGVLIAVRLSWQSLMGLGAAVAGGFSANTQEEGSRPESQRTWVLGPAGY